MKTSSVLTCSLIRTFESSPVSLVITAVRHLPEFTEVYGIEELRLPNRELSKFLLKELQLRFEEIWYRVRGICDS